MQKRPPFAGIGLLHSRFCVDTPPPHVREQLLHSDQLPHPPLSGVISSIGTHSPFWHHLRLPQFVPGAVGRIFVTHSPFTRHHNWEQISFSDEQELTFSSLKLYCNRHCSSALYNAPGGSSGYSYWSFDSGLSSRHPPSPWLKKHKS